MTGVIKTVSSRMEEARLDAARKSRKVNDKSRRWALIVRSAVARLVIRPRDAILVISMYRTSEVFDD